MIEECTLRQWAAGDVAVREEDDIGRYYSLTFIHNDDTQTVINEMNSDELKILQAVVNAAIGSIDQKTQEATT